MSGYYVCFTGDDGRVTNRVEIFAAHDEEAKQRAKHYGRKAARSRNSIRRSKAASVGGLFHSRTGSRASE